jgi:hypothetical protein
MPTALRHSAHTSTNTVELDFTLPVFRMGTIGIQYCISVHVHRVQVQITVNYPYTGFLAPAGYAARWCGVTGIRQGAGRRAACRPAEGRGAAGQLVRRAQARLPQQSGSGA